MFSLMNYSSMSWLNLSLLFVQISYGVFWLYSGLNGVFKWKAPPSVSPEIDNIGLVFIKSGFLMTTVKGLEILIALLFITDKASFLATLLLTPLLFGICGLHLRYNPKPWLIVTTVSLPLVALIAKHWDHWPCLFN